MGEIIEKDKEPTASSPLSSTELFPHKQLQGQHINLWRTRILEWVACLDQLVYYFNKSTELERVRATKIEKLAQTLVKDTATGSFATIFKPLSEFNEKLVSEAQTAQRKTQASVVKSLLELRSFALASLKQYDAGIKKMKKPLKKSRDEALYVVNTHARTQTQKVHKNDPWLLEKKCRSVLTSLVVQENRFV
jgi:hypothetical protein